MNVKAREITNLELYNTAWGTYSAHTMDKHARPPHAIRKPFELEGNYYICTGGAFGVIYRDSMTGFKDEAFCSLVVPWSENIERPEGLFYNDIYTDPDGNKWVIIAEDVLTVHKSDQPIYPAQQTKMQFEDTQS